MPTRAAIPPLLPNGTGGGIRFSIKKDKSRSYCYPGERDILRDVFIHPFGVTALAFLPESVVEWNRETRTDELAEAYGDYERGRKELDRILPDIRERGLYSALYGCQRICAPIRYKSGDLAGVLGLSILGKGEGREPEKLMEAVREIEAQDL